MRKMMSLVLSFSLLGSGNVFASKTEGPASSDSRPQSQSLSPASPTSISERKIAPLQDAVLKFLDQYGQGADTKGSLGDVRTQLTKLRKSGIETKVSPDLDDASLKEAILKTASATTFQVAKQGDRQDFQNWCLKWGVGIFLTLAAVQSCTSHNPVVPSTEQTTTAPGTHTIK